MAIYIREKFSLDKVREELGNKESLFYFAERDNKILGYLKLNWGCAQTEQVSGNAIEIERIYLHSTYQGQGVGRLLYERALNFAVTHAARFLWLGVWEKNIEAIRFYEKLGFSAFDKHPFYLGADKQTDILMKIDLEELKATTPEN